MTDGNVYTDINTQYVAVKSWVKQVSKRSKDECMNTFHQS
jgi:hypothetical protein